MSILQKTNRYTFLYIFFLGAYVFTLAIFPQNIIKNRLENESKIADKKKFNETNFTRPFRKIWNFSVENLLSLNIASDNASELLLTTIDGKISLLDSETGEKHWESEMGGRIVSKPFIENIENNIYLVTEPSVDASKNTSDLAEIETGTENRNESNYSTVRSLNIKTGLTEWQTKIPEETNAANAEKADIINSEPDQKFLYTFNSSLLLIDKFGNLMCLNRENGTLLWKRELNLKLSTKPLFIHDKIILSTTEKQIAFVSLEDGQILYKFPISEAVSALNYIEEKNQIIWGGRGGNVTSLIIDIKNQTKNIVWKFRNGAEISDLTLTNRGILVSSFDNFMYLISEERGELIWKKRLGGRISDAPLIKAGYITVTNIADSSAAILDLNNGKTVNKISLPEDFYFIGKPLAAQNKIILTTQKGIFSFDNGSLSENK
jgi:outer membrane protein assembly factor BamB